MKKKGGKEMAKDVVVKKGEKKGDDRREWRGGKGRADENDGLKRKGKKV